MKMSSLSIRQPWATLIVHASKNIENRSWPTRFRGPFLIHASKGMTDDEYRDAIQFAHFTCGVSKELLQKHVEAVALDGLRGGIVGYAELVDCISTDRHESLKPNQRSPWFMGEYGFQLANVHALPFMPITGRLGFFEVEVPDDYLPEHLRERIAA